MGNIFSNKMDDKPETTRQRTRGALVKNRDISKSNPDLLENDKPAIRQRKFVNIGNIKVSIIQ